MYGGGHTGRDIISEKNNLGTSKTVRNNFYEFVKRCITEQTLKWDITKILSLTINRAENNSKTNR